MIRSPKAQCVFWEVKTNLSSKYHYFYRLIHAAMEAGKSLIIIIEDMNATDSLPDMSTYSAGAYLLKLVSAEGIQYTKIIKI